MMASRYTFGYAPHWRAKFDPRIVLTQQWANGQEQVLRAFTPAEARRLEANLSRCINLAIAHPTRSQPAKVRKRAR